MFIFELNNCIINTDLLNNFIYLIKDINNLVSIFILNKTAFISISILGLICLMLGKGAQKLGKLTVGTLTILGGIDGSWSLKERIEILNKTPENKPNTSGNNGGTSNNNGGTSGNNDGTSGNNGGTSGNNDTSGNNTNNDNK